MHIARAKPGGSLVTHKIYLFIDIKVGIYARKVNIRGNKKEIQKLLLMSHVQWFVYFKIRQRRIPFVITYVKVKENRLGRDNR